MTRDEAIDLAMKAREKWGGGSSEYWLVIALEALGVLKIDEPKPNTIYGKINDAMAKVTSTTAPSDIRLAFEDAGLEIVEKVQRVDRVTDGQGE